MSEIQKIADAWIEMWTHDVDDPKREKFSWVDDFEYEATHEKPETGIELILEILRRNPGTEIIEVLAAGPLEDLLAYHGEAIIDRVEVEARTNGAFASLLGGVWQNAMPDSVWERIMGVWDRSDWDGNPRA